MDEPNFIARRDYIRSTLLKNGPNVYMPKPKDGEIIKVYSSDLSIPEYLKTRNMNLKKRITIYFSTMFQIDRFNIANIFETALCPSIIDGEIDYFVLVKAEGLNNLAYTRSDNTPAGEDKVSDADVEILLKLFDRIKLNKQNTVIDIVAYSEGTPQASATTFKLSNLGFNIRQFVSICGAGIIGVQNQKHGRPIIHTFRSIVNMFKNRKISLEEGIYDLTSLVAPLYEGEDDRTWGEWNVNYWTERFILTLLGINNFFKIDGVPMERLKAAVTVSPYLSRLAEKHIPMVFFDAKRDIFFDNQKMRRAIASLKTINPKIIEINSDVLHWFAHEHPTMIAQAIVNAEIKRGWKPGILS